MNICSRGKRKIKNELYIKCGKACFSILASQVHALGALLITDAVARGTKGHTSQTVATDGREDGGRGRRGATQIDAGRRTKCLACVGVFL